MKLIDDYSGESVEVGLYGSTMGRALDRLELSPKDIVQIYQDLSSGSEVKVQQLANVFEELVTRFTPEANKRAWKSKS